MSLNKRITECYYIISGIFYGLAILGPAIGYLAGGAFLDIYVDVYRADVDRYILHVH